MSLFDHEPKVSECLFPLMSATENNHFRRNIMRIMLRAVQILGWSSSGLSISHRLTKTHKSINQLNLSASTISRPRRARISHLNSTHMSSSRLGSDPIPNSPPFVSVQSYVSLIHSPPPNRSFSKGGFLFFNVVVVCYYKEMFVRLSFVNGVEGLRSMRYLKEKRIFELFAHTVAKSLIRILRWL